MKIGNEEKNKNLKILSVLKEDCQGFGLLVNKAEKRTKAFKYQFMSEPLAFATPESSLYQSDKAGLKNDFINLSKSSRNKYQQMPIGW